MTQLFEGWWTLIKFPLKIVPILQFKFSRALDRARTHAVKASHTHAPSLTDLHLPLERMEGPCLPTPPHYFFEGWGHYIKCPPCAVSLVHLYHETHVLHCVRPNPVSRHCPQSWVGGGGPTMFPSFDNSCVLMLLSHLVEYECLKFAMNPPKCCDWIVNNILGRP